MRVAFHAAHDRVERCKILSAKLIEWGHEVCWYDGSACDRLVIDHILSQREVIESAVCGKRIVIDGAQLDTELAETSISAFQNPRAKHYGLKYLVIPPAPYSYSPGTKSRTVFVNMGAVDVDDSARVIAQQLKDLGLLAIIRRSGNHLLTPNNAEFARLEDLYDATRECVFSVSVYDNWLFRILSCGLPTILLEQKRFKNLADCCIICKCRDRLPEMMNELYKDEYKRTQMSLISQYIIDGEGTERVCNLILE